MATENQVFATRSGSEYLLAGSQARNEDEISLLALLILLAERKRAIFWITGAFTVSAIVIALLLPKRYTAKVTLLPPQQNSSMGGALASQIGNLGAFGALAGNFGLKNPNDMYVAMFRSETVENAMIKHFALMQEYHQHYLSDARKDFEHNAKVDGGGKDGLIRISVEDGDPARAAELANGYVDQFRALSQHLAISEAGQRALFFKDQLEQAKENLANAEQSLAETEKKTGLIQVDSQARALIESGAALNAQIASKEVQIQAMRTYATAQNAQLIQAQQELDSLRAQLAKLGGSQDLNAGGILVPKDRVPKASIEYLRKLRDVKYYETMFQILARQFEFAKLDEAKEGALIQVLDRATPPDRRSSPRRSLIVILSTLAGLVVGLLYAFSASAMDRLRNNPETSSQFAILRRKLSLRHQ